MRLQGQIRQALFLHWVVAPDLIQAQLPIGLAPDLYQAHAWLGVVCLATDQLRLMPFPAWLSPGQMVQINVRTYVTYRGVPAVWFLSVDCASQLGTWAGRHLLHLPCHPAAITMTNNRLSARRHDGVTRFEAEWRREKELGSATPQSLESFLIERYWLVAHRRGKLFTSRVNHDPWQLHTVAVESWSSSLIDRRVDHAVEGAPPSFSYSKEKTDALP
jgi:uncharacterized protein YqjF (DUF2071 family)